MRMGRVWHALERGQFCHQGFLCLHLPQYVRHLLKGSSV